MMPEVDYDSTDYSEGYDDAVKDIKTLGILFAREALSMMQDEPQAEDFWYILGYRAAVNNHNAPPEA